MNNRIVKKRKREGPVRGLVCCPTCNGRGQVEGIGLQGVGPRKKWVKKKKKKDPESDPLGLFPAEIWERILLAQIPEMQIVSFFVCKVWRDILAAISTEGARTQQKLRNRAKLVHYCISQGNVPLLQWAYDHGWACRTLFSTGACIYVTPNALKLSASCGHVSMFDFLHRKCRVAQITSEYVREALDHQHLELLDYFQRRASPYAWPTDRLGFAIFQGRSRTVKWLCEAQHLTPDLANFKTAAKFGHLTILKYLLGTVNRMYTDTLPRELAVTAVKCGQLGVLKYLAKCYIFSLPCTIVDKLAGANKPEMVQYLLREFNGRWDPEN